MGDKGDIRGWEGNSVSEWFVRQRERSGGWTG